LPDPPDGVGAGVEGLGDAVVRPGGATLGGVGLEQDAGMGQLLGGRLASGDQILQLLAFLYGQRNLVLLHGVPPEAATASEEPTQEQAASQKWRPTSPL